MAGKSFPKKSSKKGYQLQVSHLKSTCPQIINTSDVELRLGKGSKGKGGDNGGHYWHIYINDVRAGFIFINWISEEPLGEHASIQIKVNTNLQNRGIGRIAYRLACELSQYNTVFAHMRKSNLASKRAAEAAGFHVYSESPQLTMVWNRSSKE